MRAACLWLSRVAAVVLAGVELRKLALMGFEPHQKCPLPRNMLHNILNLEPPITLSLPPHSVTQPRIDDASSNPTSFVPLVVYRMKLA